jgi:hypothetical protein
MASGDSAAREIVSALYWRRSEVVVTGHAKIIALAGRYLPHLVRLGQRLAAGEMVRLVDKSSKEPRRRR